MSESMCRPFIKRVRYAVVLILCGDLVGSFALTPATAQETPVATYTFDGITRQLKQEDVAARRKASVEVLNADRDFQITVLPSLMTTLRKENDPQVRLAILETITNLGPDAESMIPILLNAMKTNHGSSGDEKAHQHYRTALALAAIGPASIDGLRELLAESKESVRAEAAMALGRIGRRASSATDELIALLNDKSQRVAQEAAIALGKLGQSTSEPLLKKMENGSPAVQARALEAFARMDELVPDARIAIVKATDHDDPMVRAGALRIVEKCELSTERLGDLLAKGLEQTDETVRLAAANVLITRQDLIRDRQPDLANLLRSKDEQIAKHAAFVIARLGRESAPVLMDSLQGESCHVEMIGDALGGLGPRIQPWLVEQMSHSNSRVRRAAARAIGKLRPANSVGVDQLRRGLSDDDRLVQAACLTSLGDLGPRAEVALDSIREKLSDQSDEIRLLAIDVIFTISKTEQSVEDFIRLLDDPSAQVQMKAIQILRAIGPIGRKAIPPIIAKLSASTTDIRLAATEYLRNHGPFAEDALPSLTGMLDDQSPEIRLAAVKTIAQLRSAGMPAFDRLVAMLKDQDSGVRVAVLLALSATGAEFAQLQPHLVSAMQGDDAALQAESLRLIGRSGRPAAALIPQIIALAEKEDQRKAVERALRGFQRTGPLVESIPSLIELVDHKNKSVRKLAIEFLGLAGTSASSAIPSVERLKDDPDKSLQEAAVSALKKIAE